MEILGRLTADAKVNELRDGRKVVNFSIAINDYYKEKGSGDTKQLTTFVNCAYWISSTVVQWLLKGSSVSLFGRISANAYKDKQGDPKASINFHVNNIKFIAQPPRKEGISEQAAGTKNDNNGWQPNQQQPIQTAGNTYLPTPQAAQVNTTPSFNQATNGTGDLGDDLPF